MKRIKLKKLLCLGMAAMLVFPTAPQMMVKAEEVVVQSTEADDFGYRELEDGTVEITGYYGNDTEVIIPEEIDGKRVTSIGDIAFSYCAGLTSITVPEGVTSIGDYAFEDCSSLTGIVIPKGVTSIGKSAFGDCSGLKSIEIPKGVTNIADWTFFGCSSLTSIAIPEGVTSIGENAFNKCSGLTSISIPEGVTSIGERAFSECSGLTSIVIPEGVTSIADWTFFGCSSLTSIVIPKGVTSIGENAFCECSGLTSISIPEEITHIGDYAFWDCSGLTSITIPEKVTSIGNLAFDDCDNLVITCIKDSYAHTYVIENYLPYRLNGYNIVTLDTNGGNALNQNRRDIKDGEAIGEIPVATRNNYTFKGWFTQKSGGTQVTAATIINSDMTIYAQWEEVKQSIEKAVITLSTDSVIYDGTAKIPTVKSVTVNGKILTVDTDYTVSYQNNTNSGTASVIITGKGNYNGIATKNFTIQAASLNNAAVALSTTSYNYDGKAKNPAVTSVKWGNQILKNGTDYTVSYANNVNIGTASVTITGEGNYTGTVTKTFQITAKKGTTFTVGANKYKIIGSAEVAFVGLKSTKTTKVTIPKTVKYGGKSFKVTAVADKALYKKTKVTSVVIGSNVKTIGASVFEGCKKLSKVTIGSNVTKLGDKAFKNCTSLKSIIIPSKVTNIGKEAFRSCSKLSSITIKSTKLKSVGKNALKGIKSTAKIKVPAKKLTAYKNLLKSKGQGKKVKIIK